MIAPFYVLLPKRWRRIDEHGTNTYLARAALISGVGEAVVALVVLAFWYMAFFNLFGARYFGYVSTHGTTVATEIAGEAGLVGFVINPLTWVALYFGIEGVFRAIAALSTGEIVGSLPFCGAELLWRYSRRKPAAPELPLVQDEITPGGSACDIQIASCRARDGWKYPFTLRYGGTYFQVIGEKYLGAGPRPYVYLLRRLPAGEKAGGLQNYDPSDVLAPVYRLEKL